VLTVAVPTRTVDRASTDALVLLALAAPLLVAALAVAGWLVVRAALHPVDVLRREAAEISTLDADRRLPAVSGDDEIARLAGTLDAMLGRLHVSFARERAFVDDASHELRTPIAVLRGELDLALGALDDSDPDLGEVGQSVRAAHGQVLRLSRLAEDLLLLAREREGTLVVSREPIDLLTLAEEEARRLAPVFGVGVEVTGDAAIADADADRVRQVLANLAANSAAAGAARIEIRVTSAATVEWADDGPGFPPDLLDSAFERFVRGDPARASDGGAGLGLSIVRAIVAAHGGRVAVRNGPPLGGAVVIVEFPPD
jgi:signal transduction histidine kinase